MFEQAVNTGLAAYGSLKHVPGPLFSGEAYLVRQPTPAKPKNR